MTLDWICFGFVVVLLLLGIWRGFLAQVVRIVSLVAASVLAGPLSPRVQEFLGRWMDTDTLLVDALSVALAWLGCYLALLVAGSIVVRILRGASRTVNAVDRVLGGLLGGLIGIMVAYLGVSALLLLAAPLGRVLPLEKLEVDRSTFASVVQRHNLLTALGAPHAGQMNELVRIFSEDEGVDDLLRDPRVRRIRESQAVRRVLEDPEIRGAAQEGDWRAVLGHPKVRAALQDPQVRQLLGDLDLGELAERVGRGTAP